jgi:hypothetical protein
VSQLRAFIIRLLFSILLAFLIGWFFFEKTTPVKVILLAGFLLGFSYLFRYLRRRDEGEDRER